MTTENYQLPAEGHEGEPVMISRFSIIVLATTLLGMGVGSSLPPACGAICLGGGLIGIVSFACFEGTARQRYQTVIDMSRRRAEHRLSKHLRNSDDNWLDSRDYSEAIAATN